MGPTSTELPCAAPYTSLRDPWGPSDLLGWKAARRVTQLLGKPQSLLARASTCPAASASPSLALRADEGVTFPRRIGFLEQVTVLEVERFSGALV